MNATRTIAEVEYTVSDSLEVGGFAGWKNPNEAESEQNDLMKVLEVNGDRCLVEHQNTGMHLSPTRIVATSDLVGLVIK